MAILAEVARDEKGPTIYGIRARKGSAKPYTTKKPETSEERLVGRLRRFYEACTTITYNVVNPLLLRAASLDYPRRRLLGNNASKSAGTINLVGSIIFRTRKSYRREI